MTAQVTVPPETGVVPAAMVTVGSVVSAKAPVSVAVMTKLPLFLVTVRSPGATLLRASRAASSVAAVAL